MEEVAGKDIEVNRSDAANDHVLSESDDLLVAVSSSSTLTEDRSSGPVSDTSFEQLETVEIVGDKSTIEEAEELPKLLETPEPEKTGKNVKFNLRKSLAWDSAFFTSDGVLDADELSTMIEGGEKSTKHQLPGIEEEVYRSMDSISTLESENLTLESLEAELFEDIRASIQRSNHKSSLNNSSINLSSAQKDSQTKVSSSSKKVDHDSGKRLQMKPTARIKDNNTLQMKPATRTKDNNALQMKPTSIPQPKIISRMNSNSTSALTKRASLSTNHAKKDQETAKQTHVTLKGNQATKTTTTQGPKTTIPRRGVPKSFINSKPSSSISSNLHKTDPTRPSSSCSNSSSCSSGTDIKTLSRKKLDLKAGKLTTAQIPKTPSRIINMKNKPSHVNSRISSSNNNISPASSISEWSSESSSSISDINQRSTKSRVSIETCVSYRSSIESSSSVHLNDQNLNENVNEKVGVNSLKSGSLSRPPSVQPTGLRMPSPKIGFFDGGKSGVRTPTGGIESQSKFGKFPPRKTTATNTKPNPQKTAPKLEQPLKTSRAVKNGAVTSDVLNHKNEEIKIVSVEEKINICKIDTEVENNGVKVVSNDCFVVKDNKVDKIITDISRTPFAVKNSVCDMN